jgi:carbamoyl-phosphate synthase large subunit
MAKILILGASSDNIPLIKKCKSLGDYVIVADYNSESPGFEIANKKYLVSIIDDEGLLDIAKKENLDGILTISDLPTKTLSYLCNELKLIGPNIKPSTFSKNKFLLRKALNENYFNTPNFYLINKKLDLEKVDTFPVVMKPVDSVASRGVKKINSKEELLKNYEYSNNFSASNQVIVESFIEGKEFSVEALTQNKKTDIIAITEKTIAKSNSNSFVEEKHVLPADISEKYKDRIEKTVISILDKLGFDNTATHTELKLTNEGEIYIIEIASRLGGDFIASDLIPLATGINMFENIRNIAIGKPINTKRTKDEFTEVQYFTSLNYSETLNKEEQAKNKGILVKSEKKDFKDIALNNSFDRLGYFICSSKNRNNLI